MKATQREKAVIFALAAGYIDSWLDCYRLSREKPTPDPDGQELKNARTIVTRWKQREDIKQAYENALTFLRLHDETITRKAAEQVRKEIEQEEGETGQADNNRTQKRKTARIDYSDPKAQTDKLNELINTADDPGKALDALKVIIQTQKADREAARSQKSVIYYRPVRCKQCKLYQKTGEKAGKG